MDRFRWKPTAQNNLSVGRLPYKQVMLVNFEQDPVCYLKSMGFMIPGPAGQLYSMPNDSGLIKESYKIGINHDNLMQQFKINQ